MRKIIGKVLFAVFFSFLLFMLLITRSSIFTYYRHLDTSKFGIREFDINSSKYTPYKYNNILLVPRLKIDEQTEYPKTYILLYSEKKQVIYIDYIIRGTEKIIFDKNITLDEKIKNKNLYTSSVILEQRSAYTIKEMDQFFKDDMMNISVHLKDKNIDFIIKRYDKRVWYLID